MQVLSNLTDFLVQDWLYEEGEDETKSAYIAKLTELRQVGKPSAMFAANNLVAHTVDLSHTLACANIADDIFS